MEYKLSFSVNLHDDEGDCFEKCINIHLNNGVIIQFENLESYDQFIKDMQGMRQEISENL